MLNYKKDAIIDILQRQFYIDILKNFGGITMDEMLQRLKEGEQLQTVVEKLKRRYLQKKESLDFLQRECKHEIGVCLGTELWDKDYDWVETQINICLTCGKIVPKVKYVIYIPEECNQPELYVKELRKKCVRILNKKPEISFEEFRNELKKELQKE